MIKKILMLVLLSLMLVATNVNAETKEETYKDYIAKDKIVIVDMWASWCRECKLLNPILDRIEVFNKGKVEIFPINVDTGKEIAKEFPVTRFLPTLFFYKNGELVWQHIGFISFLKIQDIVRELLKEPKKPKKDKKDEPEDCEGNCNPGSR